MMIMVGHGMIALYCVKWSFGVLVVVVCGKFQLVRKISVLGLLIRALLWLVVELLFG